MLGIHQWKMRHERITLYEAVVRPFRALVKPVVALSLAFYICQFMWVSSDSARGWISGGFLMMVWSVICAQVVGIS